MDSRNEKGAFKNENNNSISYKNFNEIPHFYNTFDNFMKNKINDHILNENQPQNHQYNFSKLMNSLYEYNKKKQELNVSQIMIILKTKNYLKEYLYKILMILHHQKDIIFLLKSIKHHP